MTNSSSTDASGATAFAAALRSSRLWRGLTQRQLAAASGVSVRAIRDLESGTTGTPRRQTVELLADALGLDDAGRDSLVRAARPDTRTVPGSGSGAPVPKGRPDQLPRDLTDHVGRDDIVASLVEILRPVPGRPVTPVVIVGMGGIGKTSLAVRIGHRVRAHYPDGALFLDLNGASGGPLSVGDALVRLLRDLDVAESGIPADVEERSALLRSVTTSRRLLLVLDNARDAVQVRPLIPGNPDCAIVITSRDDLGGLAGVHRVALPPLPPGDAWSLLEHVAGAHRLDEKPDASAQLVTRCAGLPLALRIVGARLATRSLDVRTLADRLAHAAGLSELRAGDLAVRASFEASFAVLGDGAPNHTVSPADAFRLLGAWASADLEVRAAAAIFDVSVVDAEHACDRLVDVHLLESPSPERYRFHDLIGVFARERCHADLSTTAVHAAVSRLVDWYVRTLDRATELFAPYFRRLPLDRVGPAGPEPRFADAAAALAWCDREHANLVTVVRTAADHGLHHQAWMLGTALLAYCEQRMLWPELLTVSLAARTAAVEDGDLVGEGRALTAIAVAHRRSRDTAKAIAVTEESLAVHRTLGDHMRSLSLMDLLAMTYAEAGDLDRATSILRAVIDDLESDEIRLSTSLNHLGIVRAEAGALDEAAALLERALRAAEDAGSTHSEVAALRSLGEVYLRQGALPAASRALTRCVEEARAVDDRIHEAEAQRLLARTLAAAGDRAAAALHLATALELMVALRHRDEPATRRELADLGAAARSPRRRRPLL